MLYNIDLNSLLAIDYICNRSFPGKNSEDRLYKYTHTHMDTWTHGHIHTWTHAHIHTYTHTHMHTWTQYNHNHNNKHNAR